MNQSNRMICRQILAREEQILQQYLWYQKDQVALYWQRSDKDTFDGKVSFSIMNHYKDDVRKTKARLTKIRATLKALK